MTVLIDAKGKAVSSEHWVSGLSYQPACVKMSMPRYELQACPHSIGGIPISIDASIDSSEVHFVDAAGAELAKIVNAGG